MEKVKFYIGSLIISFLLSAVLLQNHCQAENSFTKSSETNLSDASYLCDPNYFPWTRTFSYSTRNNEGFKIKTDSCGNVYVAGNTDSTSNVGNNYNFLIIKYGPGGDTLWVRSYNGIDTTSIRNDMVSDMTIDAYGNVYVTGRSTNKYGNFDYATLKFNTDGVLQWTKRFNAPYNDIDIPSAIAVDNSGNVFVTGQSRFSSADYQYVTIKYSSNGDSLWLRNYNGDGNSSSAIGLSFDDSGNCYVSGNSIRFAQSWNFVTIKYSSSGITQWTKMYNGTGANTQEVLAAMKMDIAGNIFLTGYSNMSSPNMDYLIVKYDRGGNYQWANTYNGTGNGDDYPLSLTTDQSGNVIVTGYSIGTAPNNYDVATVKYNSSGVQQWVQRFNGPGNYIDVGRDVKTDTSGNIFVSGSAYFGNYSDAVVIKYNPSGAQTGIRKFNGAADRDDQYMAISIDKLGNVHVTGGAKFNNFDYMFLTTKYPQNEFGSTLKLSAVLQGFHYSASTPFMRSDTIKVFLRSASAPYSIIDSSKQILNNTGKGEFFFPNISYGTNYYLSVKHRNSIETWSASGQWVTFNSDTASFDFIPSASKAYGSNMSQVNTSPVRFAFYGGDVNQDNAVNLTDITPIYNAAVTFTNGYVITDITGDNVTDLTDITIAYNNSTNFVSVVKP